MKIIFIDRATERHNNYISFFEDNFIPENQYKIITSLEHEPKKLKELRADILIVHKRNTVEYLRIESDDTIGGGIRIIYSEGLHSHTELDPSNHYIPYNLLYEKLEEFIDQLNDS